MPDLCSSVGYDLIHRIPKQNILSVRETSRFLRGRGVVITFKSANGATATLEIEPENIDEFLRLLGVKVDVA